MFVTFFNMETEYVTYLIQSGFMYCDDNGNFDQLFKTETGNLFSFENIMLKY